ncbi:MAG: putative glycoside hydrolase [bacterium]
MNLRFFKLFLILLLTLQLYPSSGDIVFVNADILNVRTFPTVNAKKIALAYRGDSLTILGEADDAQGKKWFKVSINKENELSGWVSADFTVKKRTDLINPMYRELDFSPQKKTAGYQSNPKVKVKGIYLTRYSATPNRLAHYLNLVKGTDINSFVIDIKNERGELLFKSVAAAKHNPGANKSLIYRNRESIEKQISKMKENNLYLIARVVTFKDDDYAKNNPETAIDDNETGTTYIDRDKQRWVSPHNRKYWEYLIALCKEAADLGFNEIQFDYIRFTDWKSNLNFKNEMRESKSLAIQRFLQYAHSELSLKEIYISADIFGLVASASDDLNLGQYWEGISNVVDYISPMIYPSHYSNGFGGILIPDTAPYTIVYISARDSVARNKNIETPAIIRPWIQDFTAIWLKGHLDYTKKEVMDQVRALNEHGIDEFLLWNPKNQYQYFK